MIHDALRDRRTWGRLPGSARLHRQPFCTRCPSARRSSVPARPGREGRRGLPQDPLLGLRTLYPLDPVHPFLLREIGDCPVYPGDDGAEIVQLYRRWDQDEASVSLLWRTLFENPQEVSGIVGYEYTPFFSSQL